MYSPIVQNDSRLLPAINSAGCLFRVLSYGVEELAVKAGLSILTPEKIVELYWRLVKLNTDSDYRGMAANCYVYSHTDVMEETGKILNCPVQAFYIESESYDEDRVHPYRTNIPARANYWITHRELPSTVGHFLKASEDHEPRWDPFFPNARLGKELSFRHYRIEVVK